MSEENPAEQASATEQPSPTVEEETQPPEDLVTIDEFFRSKLVAGQIIAAERVEKSKKLLKLAVNLGEPGGPRQIVAGIGKRYTPEELIGVKVVVVSNLKPATLMGVESQGMLLAAKSAATGLEILIPNAEVEVGASIG